MQRGLWISTFIFGVLSVPAIAGAQPCAGDCDADNRVTVDELVKVLEPFTGENARILSYGPANLLFILKNLFRR